MTVTLNPRLRLGLYVLTVIGTPVVVYLRASGIIGDLELGLWGAEVAAVSSLAALNTASATPNNSIRVLTDAEMEEFERRYSERANLRASVADRLGKPIYGEHRAD